MNYGFKNKNKGFTRSAVRLRRITAGFTLVETIVSLAIFGASVAALIVISSQGIQDANFAKNKLTASYLAQEGIELVRAMRDGEILSLGTFADFINTMNSGGCVNPSACNIDATDLSISLCPPNCNLEYSSSGFYTPSSNNSQFERSITVDASSFGSDEVLVTVDVSWSQGSATKHVIMTENLFNWISL